MWLKTWCYSKITKGLWYQRVPCLKEYCSHQSGSLLLFLSLDILYWISEFSGAEKWHTKWERPCAHSSAIPKRGITQEQPPASGLRGHYLSAAGVEGMSVSLGPCWPSAGHFDTARRSLKHVLQVCRCLSPLAFCREFMSTRRGFHQGSSCLQTYGQANLSVNRKEMCLRFTSPSSSWYFLAKPDFLGFQFWFHSIHHQSTNCLLDIAALKLCPCLLFIAVTFFSIYQILCVLLKCSWGVSFTSLEIFLCQTAECTTLLQQNLKAELEHFPKVLKINLFEDLKKKGCQMNFMLFLISNNLFI